MFVQQLLTKTSRRGGVTPFVVISIGAFLAALALAVDSANLWNAQVEMRSASDASVLAAALALVDDDLLTGQPAVMATLVGRARAAAAAYGLANPVAGRPLEIDLNPQHDPLGDIVFGYLPTSKAGQFQPATDLSDLHLNAVRIIARRTRERGNPAGTYFARLFHLSAADVVTTATAYIDRDVIGFRPRGQQPLPLVPLAVLTDPTLTNEDAWESQVIKPFLNLGLDGEDLYRFDRARQTFLSASQMSSGDGIFEMTVHIPLAGQPSVPGDDPNGCFLQIGNTDFDALCRQIIGGVAASDLLELGGQFALGWDNRLFLAGNPVLPDVNDHRLGKLLNALKTLQLTAEPRVWPLFASMHNSGSTNEATVVVQGFVAARLAAVELATIGEGAQDDPKRMELSLTLQPCMLATSTALTDAARRDLNPTVNIHNAYICKVRLVE